MLKSNLKKIVDERGIKQTWLAKRAGINRATLSNIVQDRHTPTIEVALRIAYALDLEVTDIWKVVELQDFEGKSYIIPIVKRNE